MANINFTCPQCGHSLQLPATLAGQQGKCPKCNAVVMITAAQQQPAQQQPAQQQPVQQQPVQQQPVYQQPVQQQPVYQQPSPYQQPGQPQFQQPYQKQYPKYEEELLTGNAAMFSKLWKIYCASIALLIIAALMMVFVEIVFASAGVIGGVVGILALLCFFVGGLGGAVSSVWLAVNMWMAIYRYWTVLQGGHARTTPEKAIGFLFIPFYNFYWAYNITVGLRDDMNKYIYNHRSDIPPITVNNTWLIAYILSCLPYINLLTLPFYLWEFDRRNKELAFAASRILHG